MYELSNMDHKMPFPASSEGDGSAMIVGVTLGEDLNNEKKGRALHPKALTRHIFLSILGFETIPDESITEGSTTANQKESPKDDIKDETVTCFPFFFLQAYCYA